MYTSGRRGVERMETYKVRIQGNKPLLMHNPQGMIGDKPTRRRGEHPDPKAEAETYLYKDDKGEICIPAAMIKACIREGGRNYKISGRRTSFAAMIKAGLEIFPMMVPLVSDGPWEVDLRSVVIQRQRILRARPRFNSWALEFEIRNHDPDIIHCDTLEKIIIDAGKYYGLGDFRPEFGLFEVEEFSIKSG